MGTSIPPILTIALCRGIAVGVFFVGENKLALRRLLCQGITYIKDRQEAVFIIGELEGRRRGTVDAPAADILAAAGSGAQGIALIEAAAENSVRCGTYALRGVAEVSYGRPSADSGSVSQTAADAEPPGSCRTGTRLRKSSRPPGC